MSIDKLAIWTVYENPSDYPDMYVARLWEIGGRSAIAATGQLMVEKRLFKLRQRLRKLGLFCMPRQDDDDPVIVETWM